MTSESEVPTVLVRIARVRHTLEAAFRSVGLRQAEAFRISDSLIDAELVEVPTHGLLRVPAYLGAIASGVYQASADIRRRRPAAAVTLLDGAHSLGYLPTWEGVSDAVAAAAEFGIGFVGVANIGEFGRAGYYAEEAARRGFVAIVCQNTPPLLGAPGSRVATHGNNPLSFSAPGSDAPLFDAAFTPRSGGELIRRSLLGLDLPIEWGYVDNDGAPTTNPARALEGVWPAAGGAKGFGLAVLVDLLAGILTGASSGQDVARGMPVVGAAVIALDPARIGAIDALGPRFRASAEAVRAGGGRWPGDRVRAARERNTPSGTLSVPQPIHDAVRDALKAVDPGLEL